MTTVVSVLDAFSMNTNERNVTFESLKDFNRLLKKHVLEG